MVKYLTNMKKAEDMKKEFIAKERTKLIEFMNSIDISDWVEYNGVRCLEYHIKSLDQEDIQDILDEMVELGYHVDTVYQDNKLFSLILSITNNPGVFKRSSFKCANPASIDNLNLNYAHPSPYVYNDFRL